MRPLFLALTLSACSSSTFIDGGYSVSEVSCVAIGSPVSNQIRYRRCELK